MYREKIPNTGNGASLTAILTTLHYQASQGNGKPFTRTKIPLPGDETVYSTPDKEVPVFTPDPEQPTEKSKQPLQRKRSGQYLRTSDGTLVPI